VVTRNGLRLQPPEGIEWIGDDSSVSFGLPQRGGYSQSTINAPSDISVWIDNILQTQSVGLTTGTYSVTAWTGSNTPGRQVVFTTPPGSGARILITVSTAADYAIISNQLQISAAVILDDLFAVTTWNDTAQLWPLTLVFKGPVTESVTITEGYDETNYDPLFVDGSATGTYPAGTLIVGNTYTILTAGTTVWTSIGAANNNPGTVFVATGIGSGTGTASGIITVRSSATDDFNNDPGSFDYSAGTTIYTNNFYLERSLNNASRLWVTLNGSRLFEGTDYTVSGDYLILAN
jgi:hypothetical protein